jgi:hypothetical protein
MVKGSTFTCKHKIGNDVSPTSSSLLYKINQAIRDLVQKIQMIDARKESSVQAASTITQTGLKYLTGKLLRWGCQGEVEGVPKLTFGKITSFSYPLS